MQQMQRPAHHRLRPPMPHHLAAVERAGKLPHHVIRRPTGGIIAIGRHADRDRRRRHFVVIIVAPARPRRQVIFGHLPHAQPFGEMLGKGIGISRQGQRRFGRFRHGAVMAVLAGHVEESRDHDIGPPLPIGAHQPLDGALLAPARQRIGAGFGKAEIMHRIVWSMPQPGNIGIEHPRRFFHLARAHHAQCAGALGAKRVLSAFAAGRAGNDHPHPHAEPHQRQHAALLIIGMGAGVHHGQGRAETAQRIVQFDQGGLGLAAAQKFAIVQHD